ncbi:acyl carrier protein [Portibacter marinus]|uniref:acyl carrier protein n=1 Tax=Portibacter marinus TaxID=2898660 RepID=UPI001F294287|nr:acyl carrier protein [Portibacter marinus]
MKKEIIDFIQETLLGGIQGVTIEEEDDLLSTGFIESMGMMQLINFVEEHYQVNVTPQDMTIENFRTVRAIEDYILRNK